MTVTLSHRPTSAEATPALAARGVVKRFGSTVALAGVDFSVRPGEIVGVVGANGAGKSTLIGILSGASRPTDGHIEVRGAEVALTSPDAAAALGIATVQQDVDAALVPSMTVAENLVLDRIASGDLGVFPGRRRIHDAARLVAADELHVGLDEPVSRLRTSQKQQLLIARALHRGATVLILDEPTAALSITEQRRLHEQLRRLAASGTAIVYITHHLGEISAICDRVVAIREGRIAGEFTAPFTAAAVVSAMLGPLAAAARDRHDSGDGAPVLRLRGMRSRDDSAPVDLEVHDGEVLGITGLLGAGKTELLRQIVGADPIIDGELLLDGRQYRPRHPRDAVRAGVGFVPEDRRTQAEFPEWDITANVTLPDLGRYRRRGILDGRAERAAARREIDRLRIVASGPGAGLTSLSGGNRQKVVVARWLAANSRLLVLDEPFRGVDLGARADLAGLLRSGGVRAAIVASSDPEEILEVADRILVFAGGRVIQEVRPEDVDADSLADLMVPASELAWEATA